MLLRDSGYGGGFAYQAGNEGRLGGDGGEGGGGGGGGFLGAGAGAGASPWGEFGIDGSEVFSWDEVGDDHAAVAGEDGQDVFDWGGGGDRAEVGFGGVGCWDGGWDGEGESGHFALLLLLVLVLEM